MFCEWNVRLSVNEILKLANTWVNCSKLAKDLIMDHLIKRVSVLKYASITSFTVHKTISAEIVGSHALGNDYHGNIQSGKVGFWLSRPLVGLDAAQNPSNRDRPNRIGTVGQPVIYRLLYFVLTSIRSINGSDERWMIVFYLL